MTMFVGAARAGPSCLILRQTALKSCATILPFSCQQQRHAASKAVSANKKKSPSFNQKGKKEGKGEVTEEKKQKSLGAFRPLPVSSLTLEIFESGDRTPLKLPTFKPTLAMIAKATEFPTIENDPSRVYGLPKKMLLEFRLLSKPCSIVRDVTVKSVELLDGAKDKSSLDTRVVLSGRPGCGKSFLLLQMVEHSVVNGWIVIYIPRAVKLVNSTTPHEYNLRTRTYLQPAFSFQTLRRIQTTNMAQLTALTTQKKHTFERREVPIGTNLFDLIGVALKEPPLAPLILESLMSELSTQSKTPVLFAVDDFQALYCRTAYRDPHFVPIRPYHLSIPRMIMEFASGKRAFAKGAFVGSITSSDTNYKLPLELRDALELPHEHFRTPYDKISRPLMEYTTGLKAFHVPDGLSIPEAAALFEVWKDNKALVSSMYDEVFLAKYAESSGNPRDFVWKGLLSTLET